MLDDLQAEARGLLADLPRSIEMPAGTGKTQLIVAMASEAANAGHRALILTHTNAGVDALRKRLRGRVDSKHFHVDTITGWAIDLVRHYRKLADIAVPAEVDATESSLYVAGAATVALTPAIARMHQASFSYLFVDEYQDCTVTHHTLICALSQALPRTAILGDRLQGIFDFDGTLVDWTKHVQTSYPDYPRAHVPWRWRGRNDRLGEWLLAVRGSFANRGVLDLADVSVPGLEWRQATPRNELSAAYDVLRRTGSVVLLHQVRGQHKTIGQRTRGGYSIMESLSGDYMRERLAILQSADPQHYAHWLAVTAKECFTGLADVDPKYVVRRLKDNQSLIGLGRPDIPLTMAYLEAIRSRPLLGELASTMYKLERSGECHCYAHEAWFDMAHAIAQAAIDSSKSPVEHLAAIRNRLRYSGRRERKALLSRTLLVKGLEYDHVVVANADAIGDHKDLYVAMTRPRNSLTILSESPVLMMR